MFGITINQKLNRVYRVDRWEEKMKIILDCDNTMGVPRCDVDDAMALLYLLGKKEAELLAVTTTFGNNDIDTVHKMTKQLLSDIGRADLPLYKGSAQADAQSEAGQNLARLAREHRGELSILAVGSTTNLRSAYLNDPDFFDYLKQIVLMGGITETLIVGNQQMDELNLSVDHRSTLLMLEKAGKVSTMTGNHCLATLFTRKEFQQNLSGSPLGEYILEKTAYWFDYNERDYDLEGFYNWDITSAIYLMRPDLFEDHWVEVALCEQNLSKGLLLPPENADQKTARINLPTIRDIAAFKKEAYQILGRS